MERLALEKAQGSFLVAVDHHQGCVGRHGGVLGKIGGGGGLALDDLELRLNQRRQNRFELGALIAGIADQHDLHRAATTLAL